MVDSSWNAQVCFIIVHSVVLPVCLPSLRVMYLVMTKFSHPCSLLTSQKFHCSDVKKGHLIVARPAGLPSAIRNEEGLGRGCVVGWLPAVSPILLRPWFYKLILASRCK
ncbi:hypothetical protein BDN67DRAFT_333857 [Paxillus ammoniavirescens]|nr:hypothetical protein BDN67DRAFT_333857 [Paxillus ammoniavirescens]